MKNTYISYINAKLCNIMNQDDDRSILLLMYNELINLQNETNDSLKSMINNENILTIKSSINKLDNSCYESMKMMKENSKLLDFILYDIIIRIFYFLFFSFTWAYCIK